MVFHYEKTPYFLLLVLILLASIYISTIHSQSETRRAIVLVLDMNIDGGAVSFIESSVKSHPGVVYILEINSYGGYLSSADRIINIIASSGSHCIAWIPPDSYAVSAAALIALSCREVYMAPGSVIGAIKPSPYDEKIVEYIKARLRSFLEEKNIENSSLIARQLVEEAKTFTYEEAVALGIAKPAIELSEVLSSENLELTGKLTPSLWDKMISLISHPLISEILLFVGVLLILIEVFTTGFQGYGLAGILLVILALYGLTIIPVEILHIALILAGAVLIIIELFTPGFGVFGLSGVILTAIGFTLTILSTPPETLTGVVLTTTMGLVAIGGLFVFIGYKAASTTRIKRKPLSEQLLNAVGYAKTEVGETTPGTVYVLNEDWTAFSINGTIPAGSKVRVVRVEGLKLYVEKIEE